MNTDPPRTQGLPADVSRGTLACDERCDVVVVGSGLSGALAAFHLVEDGADVVIVDKGPLASGSTALSTALVQYELDVPMVELTLRLGIADAQMVYRAARGALDDLRTLVDRNGIECDLAQHSSLYLARDASDVLPLRHEALAREEIGLEARFIDAATLASQYSINRPGAIRSSIAYQLNPRALATQLITLAVHRGARLYSQTPLCDEKPSEGRPTLRTTDGHAIDASHVVYATGYQLPPWLPELRELCSFMSTYALMSRPVSAGRLWPERALLWETGTSYFYARTTADNRIIVGGEDDYELDPAARQHVLAGKTRRLLAQLHAITGIGDVEVDSAWAATFAHTADGLPLIGSPASAPRCSFTLGFGGNGTLFGLIGAQMIRDSLAGRYNPGARLFGFDRPAATPRAPRPAVAHR